MNETEKGQEVLSEPARLTMGKAERLRHRTLVERLFAHGATLYEYPLRLTWRLVGEEEMKSSFCSELPPRLGRLQMMITVPKKKLRHAVDRVLMRRRIREAYRCNRVPLLHKVLSKGNIYLELAFIYIHKEPLEYHDVEKKMKRLLSKLEAIIETNN